MKKALEIFRRDIRRILVNPVAVVIMIGVAIIPSLYAWFNILANWDPYENTSDIKIAVVDEDQGTQIDDLGETNAGEMIVERLKDNDQLGWTFVDRQEALDGVREGRYYAAFVIPSDFTSSLADVLDGDTEKAHIAYYVNEKVNAIAPKVTDTGATTLENQVSDEFVNVCGKTISEKLKAGAGDAAQGIDTATATVASDLKSAEKDVRSLAGAMDDLDKTVADARSSVAAARKTLAGLSGKTDSLAKTLSDSLDSLATTRKDTQSLATEISSALGSGARTIAGISSKANYDVGNAAGDIGWAQGKLDAAIAQLRAANTTVQGQIKTLSDARDSLANLQISNASASQLRDRVVAKLDTTIATLQSLADDQLAKIEELQSLSNQIKDGVSSVKNLSETVNNAIQGSVDSLGELQDGFVSETMPQMSSALDSFADVGGQIVGTANSLAPMLSQADGSLAQLDDVLASSATSIEDAADKLTRAADKIGSLATDVSAVQSATTFAGLKDLLDVEPTKVGEFMGSPVEMVDKNIYPVANYGSGVTPFYTNLALWVGGFVLVAIYKLEVDDECIGEFKPWQGYVGRWLLLNLIGAAQALICCVGDLALGIQCVSPVAFVFAGLLESFVYVSFIYAMAIAFKHIGKALAVVLVVLQIPGAAGLYPIEMMPGFFRALHPLLPFTYGIAAMREAIAGFYGSNYATNIAVLLVYLIPAALIGLGARRHLLNINALFDRKLGETDLMITENVGMDEARFKLSTIIKALADAPEYKRTFTERAAAFELAYPVLVRRGFMALVWVPLVLLALLFFLPMKMLMLVLWIVSLVAICTFLIVVEYLHSRVADKTRMADMSRKELYELLGKGVREEYMAFAPLDKMNLSDSSPLARFGRAKQDDQPKKGGDAR